eukprot:g18792.t1
MEETVKGEHSQGGRGAYLIRAFVQQGSAGSETSKMLRVFCSWLDSTLEIRRRLRASSSHPIREGEDAQGHVYKHAAERFFEQTGPVTTYWGQCRWGTGALSPPHQ